MELWSWVVREGGGLSVLESSRQAGRQAGDVMTDFGQKGAVFRLRAGLGAG